MTAVPAVPAAAAGGRTIAGPTINGPAINGLAIDGLSAGYGGPPVLRDIALAHLRPGMVVGLLGQNAAGKSTLLKSLAGMIRYGGSARFNHEELSGLTPRQRSALIGYQPQTAPPPTGLLVYEVALATFRAINPAMSRSAAERRIDTAFAELGLMPLALRRVETLSGGQRQLLSLALVLARQTPLLLLDEPTSALDLRWQVETLMAVRRAAADRSALALLAIHDLNLALRFCDHVAVLADGRVLASGPADGTLTPDLLRRAYGVDARIERCSSGRPIVLADRATATAIDPAPRPGSTRPGGAV